MWASMGVWRQGRGACGLPWVCGGRGGEHVGPLAALHAPTPVHFSLVGTALAGGRLPQCSARRVHGVWVVLSSMLFLWSVWAGLYSFVPWCGGFSDMLLWWLAVCCGATGCVGISHACVGGCIQPCSRSPGLGGLAPDWPNPLVWANLPVAWISLSEARVGGWGVGRGDSGDPDADEV
jgi:hypothetical protein